MSVERPTATIEALLVAPDAQDFYSTPVPSLKFSVAPNGIVDDQRYSGNTRLADVRLGAYQRGVDELLNRQSVSFVGAEDLDHISAELGLDPMVLVEAEAKRSVDNHTDEYKRMLEDLDNHQDPNRITRRFLAQCLGANILLGDFKPTDEVQNFRSLTAGMDFGPFSSSTLKFTDASVMITRPNGPCKPPGRKIVENYPAELRPDAIQHFIRVGQGRRGFVGMVAKGGEMSVNQTVRFVPLGEK